MQHVDLRSGLVEPSGGVDRDGTRTRRNPGRHRRKDEIHRDDALDVLVEFLEEAEPAAVLFRPQTVELVAERRKTFRETALDLGLEQPEAVAGSGIGHIGHYRVCLPLRKVRTSWWLIVTLSGR